MSQKVKVFRSKDPLLGVLMWGVSHSVSTRFANLPLKSTLVKPKASAGMFSCRSTNCLMWIILLCWCRMTSKHSRNFAWTTISSTSEYYEWFTVFIFRFCYILSPFLSRTRFISAVALLFAGDWCFHSVLSFHGVRFSMKIEISHARSFMNGSAQQKVSDCRRGNVIATCAFLR